MRLVSKRIFEVQDPILLATRCCKDMLFQAETGEYFLYISADQLGEKLLRLNTLSAVAWMNASPEEYGEWLDELG